MDRRPDPTDEDVLAELHDLCTAVEDLDLDDAPDTERAEPATTRGAFATAAHLAHAAIAAGLLLLFAALLPGCSELASLVGPAVGALGPVAIGAAEAAVRAEAAKAGVSLSDPKVLAAIERARKADAKAAALAEKRAAEAKARDEAEAQRIAEIAATLAELRRPCSCPTCPELPKAPAVLPVVASDAGAP